MQSDDVSKLFGSIKNDELEDIKLDDVVSSNSSDENQRNQLSISDNVS